MRWALFAYGGGGTTTMNDELNEKVNEFAQKMKKGFNLKKAIKAFTIACGLLLIVFMTVVNITFDEIGRASCRERV